MKSENGQALVEIAISMMILAILFSGIIDFGRTFHAFLAIDHAGREAARVASVGGSDAKIREAAIQSARHLKINESNIKIEPDQYKRARGENATVTLTYNIGFITPIVGRLFPDNQLRLESETVMRVE
ncbi:MAG: pilus assembly protein [Bacillus sp. (in: Bacteria)]|nr:pilus assembly protein [Bacillus sp. (in: firmicutes)]